MTDYLQPKPRFAVLLINLGSPEAPTTAAVRTYLREFLSDIRVIDLPRWQWLPILHGIVLRLRPAKSARAYRKIWQEEGSPLVVMTQRQTKALREKLPTHIRVEYAMRYGNPSTAMTLRRLSEEGIERLLVIPMYPQYGCATTASVFDGVAQGLSRLRFIPEIRLVHHWYDRPAYIAALAESIRRHFAACGVPEKLLFSFHGVPKRYVAEGDPYLSHCRQTTALVAQALGLSETQYQLIFQSRFGREEWLQPYADKTIEQLAKQGCKSLSIVCPGFSADCLETLEEMAMGNRGVFLKNGGERYDYIPALNDTPAHIDLLAELVREYTQDWGYHHIHHNAAYEAEE